MQGKQKIWIISSTILYETYVTAFRHPPSDRLAKADRAHPPSPLLLHASSPFRCFLSHAVNFPLVKGSR